MIRTGNAHAISGPSWISLPQGRANARTTSRLHPGRHVPAGCPSGPRLAESASVLCGKYSSTLRKVLFCFPHGLFCPSACHVPFRLLFSFGVPPDGAVSCVAGFVLLLIAACGRTPEAVGWCGGRGRSVLLAQVLVYDFGFGRPDFGGDFFQ